MPDRDTTTESGEDRDVASSETKGVTETRQVEELFGHPRLANGCGVMW